MLLYESRLFVASLTMKNRKNNPPIGIVVASSFWRVRCARPPGASVAAFLSIR